MGKFDKKVNKHEPDAPKHLKKANKRSNPTLNALEAKPSAEKERNMKIFAQMTKEKEYAAGGKGAADTDKMLKVHRKKEQKFNSKHKDD